MLSGQYCSAGACRDAVGFIGLAEAAEQALQSPARVGETGRGAAVRQCVFEGGAERGFGDRSIATKMARSPEQDLGVYAFGR